MGVTRPPRLAALLTVLLLTACGAEAPSATVEPAIGPSSGAPPPCVDAKLVWADSLDRLLLTNCFDQEDMASVETVWAWDGDAWELLSEDGPPANVVTGFGWDADRDVLVRYGGIPLASQTCSTETWEWDTTEWREVVAGPPEPCDHLELAWDASAARMLQVGGGRGQGLLDGTWAWDGTTWNALTGTGPPPRAHHGFVADEANKRVLLYGGLDNSRVFDDLWAWDRSGWEELTGEGGDPVLAPTMDWRPARTACCCTAAPPERRRSHPSWMRRGS